jgi:hypothetical protein
MIPGKRQSSSSASSTSKRVQKGITTGVKLYEMEICFYHSYGSKIFP